MAEQDSDLEKTELPSQRKLERAREEGQVARSRELSTFLIMLAGGAGLWLMGEHLVGQLIRLLRQGLTLQPDQLVHPQALLSHLAGLSLQALLLFAPLLLLLLLVAAFSPLLLNGWLFSLKPLQPDFGKLDPVKGLARMFSTHSLMELAKALGKSLVVGGIGAWVVWQHRDAVLLLAGEPVSRALPHLGSLLGWSFAAIMTGMLLIVAVDVPFQLWEHSKKLKMTKEEVRQEAKETEGDPQVKGRIRSL
ncbi:MAG: hypothetical protein Fur0040_09880 [Sideroxydans sp.]